MLVYYQQWSADPLENQNLVLLMHFLTKKLNNCLLGRYNAIEVSFVVIFAKAYMIYATRALYF